MHLLVGVQREGAGDGDTGELSSPRMNLLLEATAEAVYTDNTVVPLDNHMRNDGEAGEEEGVEGVEGGEEVEAAAAALLTLPPTGAAPRPHAPPCPYPTPQARGESQRAARSSRHMEYCSGSWTWR
jgi:hypothetical protein